MVWRAACPKIAPSSDTVFAVARSRPRQKTSIKMAGVRGCSPISFQFGRLPISRGDRTREIVEAEGKKQERERERESDTSWHRSIDSIISSFHASKIFRKKERKEKTRKKIFDFFTIRRAKKIRYFPSFFPLRVS